MAILQGFNHHAAHLGRARQERLVAAIGAVVAEAPFYIPAMPGSGKPLSVRMTNCGPLGWMTGYQAMHPTTCRPWPPIPDDLIALWRELADYPAPPEACLVNYYSGLSRLGSHRDADEAATAAPVLSVSLGDDATFHIGGLRRSEPKERIRLRSGDVVVLGGVSRLAYHGIDRVFAGTSDLIPEGGRINLTLRRVTLPAAA
jgi:alkylated DNA repair protein (DNA oxidative demethylase)